MDRRICIRCDCLRDLVGDHLDDSPPLEPLDVDLFAAAGLLQAKT